MPTVSTRIWRLLLSRLEDFERVIEFRDADGVTANLADWTFGAAIRATRAIDAPSLADFTFVVVPDRDGNADRAVLMTVARSVLADLDAGDYVADIFAADGDDFQARAVRFELTLE